MSTDTAIDFLYLSEPDMVRAGVTDMPLCVDTMQEVLRLLHLGDYRMAGSNNDSHGSQIRFPAESPFPHMPAPTDERRFMAMPAYLGGDFGTTGVKWYGSNIANRDRGLPRSILTFTLTDTDTGAPLAFMSANLLSAYRTGAIGGVGARFFAREESEVVGILGPGVMARTALSAFVAARAGIRAVKVKGRSPRGVLAFSQWVAQHHPGIEVIPVDDIEHVVRDSDIVSYCTTGGRGEPSTYPLVRREWVSPGTFLSMPASCDIDDGMVDPSVRTVVDSTRLYEAWASEVPAPAHATVSIIGCKFMDLIAEGRMDAASLTDLGAVIAGAQPARSSDDEIVLLSVGGMPVEDVAWATVVYRNAVRDGIGTPLNLWQQPELV